MKQLAALFALIAGLGYSQSGRTVTVTYADPNVLAPGQTATYTLKRAAGLCTGTPVFAAMQTGITGLVAVDNNVPIGNWCYTVTITIGGLESINASPVTGAVLPKAGSITKIDIAQYEAEVTANENTVYGPEEQD